LADLCPHLTMAVLRAIEEERKGPKATVPVTPHNVLVLVLVLVLILVFVLVLVLVLVSVLVSVLVLVLVLVSVLMVVYARWW
jgi:uncharacterized membrane protein